MQFDLMAGAGSWEDTAQLARRLETAGFSGMLFTEAGQTPWMMIAAAAMAAPQATSATSSPSERPHVASSP